MFSSVKIETIGRESQSLDVKKHCKLGQFNETGKSYNPGGLLVVTCKTPQPKRILVFTLLLTGKNYIFPALT